MMECPRCGFLQPPDRFCANCGLDIEKYEAPKPTWHQRLLTSAPFHVVLAAVLLLALVIFLYQARPPSDSRPLRRALLTEPSESSTAQQAAVQGSPSAQSIQSPGAEESASATAPTKTSSTDFEAAADPGLQFGGRATEAASVEALNSSADAETLTVPPPQRLNVRFYEMSNQDLQQVLTLAQNIEDTPLSRQQVATSLTIDKERLEPFLLRARPLPGYSTGVYAESVQLLITQALDLSLLGLQEDPASPAGLSIEITLQNIREGLTDVTAFTTVLLPLSETEESGPSWLSYQVSTLKPLPWTSSLLIVGAIPHSNFLGLEEGFYEGGPLAILNSNEFENRQSELVILLSGE